jgi:protein SCO1/2
MQVNLMAAGVLGVPLGAYAKYLYDDAKSPHVQSHQREGKAELGGKYTMINHRGEVKTQADFLGTWQLMYFGFTNCPDVCPAQLNRLTEALHLVKKARPSAELSPMFMCCDPGRDSVAACRKAVADYHPDLMGMTGCPGQVETLTKAYKVFFSKPTDQDVQSGDYIVDHSIATFMFDPQGNFVEYWSSNHTAEDISKRIVQEIDTWKLRTNPFG